MTTVLADPARMIAKGAPHVIHNDEELEAYTNALFQLTALENPSRSEVAAIELLTLLVERYEETHYPIPAAAPPTVCGTCRCEHSLLHCRWAFASCMKAC